MGLDLVEITMDIEETFGVSLSEDDLTAIWRNRDVMVGDLYDLILTKLELRDATRHDVRVNHSLWCELRNTVHSVTDVPLDRIELKTPLATLFPPESRRIRWGQLRDSSPYRVPELDYAPIVRVCSFLVAVAMVIVEHFHLWQFRGLKWLWPVLGILGGWMLLETYVKVLAILAPWRNSFPNGMTIVKDLCRIVLSTNYSDVCQDANVPLDERCLAVWQQLTGILVDSLGVKPDRVTFRSRLVRDLGMQ